MFIIGIHGKIGSGKDTLADYIVQNNDSFKKKSFAFKLKYMTSFLTGIELEDCFTQEGKNTYMPEWGMTVGEFQQKLGTEGMRKGVHENGWVLALFSEYNPDNYEENWIVTDVRFPNEAQAILDRGGILVKLEGDPAKIRANSSRDMNHPSETSLDDWKKWNYVYTNDGSLEDLYEFGNQVLLDLCGQ